MPPSMWLPHATKQCWPDLLLGSPLLGFDVLIILSQSLVHGNSVIMEPLSLLCLQNRMYCSGEEKGDHRQQERRRRRRQKHNGKKNSVSSTAECSSTTYILRGSRNIVATAVNR